MIRNGASLPRILCTDLGSWLHPWHPQVEQGSDGFHNMCNWDATPQLPVVAGSSTTFFLSVSKISLRPSKSLEDCDSREFISLRKLRELKSHPPYDRQTESPLHPPAQHFLPSDWWISGATFSLQSSISVASKYVYTCHFYCVRTPVSRDNLWPIRCVCLWAHACFIHCIDIPYRVHVSLQH